jgi:hypothetical protein
MTEQDAALFLKKSAALFDGLESRQIDCFLQMCAPHIFDAKIRLLRGVSTWDDLSLYCSFLRYMDDGEQYSLALTTFDNSLSFPQYEQSTFVGHGKGTHSLRTYRHLSSNNNHFFEKAYKQGTRSLTRALFFDMHVRATQSSLVDACPEIMHVYRGNHIALVYYNYLQSTTPPTNKEAIDVSRHLLLQLSKVPCLELTANALQGSETVTSLGNEPNYRLAMREAGQWLTTEQNAVFRRIQSQAELPPYVFSHGDFAPWNMTTNGNLFDFDRCGYYSWGYDMAFLLSKTLTFQHADELLAFSSQHLMSPPDSRALFAYIYWCFLFYLAFRSRNKCSDTLLNSLWQLLVKKIQ